MDECKSETNNLKKCLPGIKMHACQVRGGSNRTYDVINIMLRKYLQLKPLVDYTADVVTDECELSLTYTKKKRDLSVVIIVESCFTKSQKLVAAHVSYADHTLSPLVCPEQISPDEYQVDFDSSVINDPRNEPLKSGQLHLVFQFEFRKRDTRRVFPFSGVKINGNHAHTFRPQLRNRLETEEDAVSESLRRAFQEPKFGDFEILVVPDKRFRVHRAILAARSEFLAKCVDRAEGGFKLSRTNHLAVGLMLEYLYCGKIVPGSVDELIDVLALSVNLEIASLVTLCVRHLKKIICLFNSSKILKAAEILSLESLAEEVKDYLKRNKNVCELLFLNPE